MACIHTPHLNSMQAYPPSRPPSKQSRIYRTDIYLDAISDAHGVPPPPPPQDAHTWLHLQARPLARTVGPIPSLVALAEAIQAGPMAAALARTRHLHHLTGGEGGVNATHTSHIGMVESLAGGALSVPLAPLTCENWRPHVPQTHLRHCLSSQAHLFAQLASEALVHAGTLELGSVCLAPALGPVQIHPGHLGRGEEPGNLCHHHTPLSWLAFHLRRGTRHCHY